ncbi:PPIC-type PPIASE domain-containing protein [Shimia gijangensis]|uniref:peptidylprolyl isomerase n=1 Tax=Shimia gijangensis TaxID=1470563 RepID=A0A1M6SJI6_9RHOB|nr:peptidylprolyl isomerase [Shimia gijangensis]SHK44901.1 PPIC-type PPIASE domain-containing protein [Shimia gijangensis]
MITTLLRQPLLHFFVIGAALFALFSVVDDTPPTPDRPVIVVSTQDAQWLASQFQATRNRPPSAKELEAIVDAYVREEIYVREALALGLDQGDTIVRKRLSQKMEFLTEAGAEASVVDDTMLKAYFDENAETYRSAPRVAFAQVFLPEPVQESLPAILDALAEGGDFTQVGVRSLLPAIVSPISAQAVDGTFGQGVFEQIAKLEPGTWSGPVTSGYGQHLVRLDVFSPGELPAFEAVRDRIEQDWRRDKAEDLRLERFDQLRNQYDIETPDLSQVLSQ